MVGPLGVKLREVPSSGPESPPKAEELGALIVGLIHCNQVGVCCAGGGLGRRNQKRFRQVVFFKPYFFPLCLATIPKVPGIVERGQYFLNSPRTRINGFAYWKQTLWPRQIKGGLSGASVCGAVHIRTIGESICKLCSPPTVDVDSL